MVQSEARGRIERLVGAWNEAVERTGVGVPADPEREAAPACHILKLCKSRQEFDLRLRLFLGEEWRVYLTLSAFSRAYEPLSRAEELWRKAERAREIAGMQAGNPPTSMERIREVWRAEKDPDGVSRVLKEWFDTTDV